jgi:hypothetical protein
VFLFESKRPGGEATVEGDVVIVRRLDDPESTYDRTQWGSRLKREAIKLSAELQAETGRRTWVQGVVFVWAPFPQRVVDSNRIVYVHGDELAAWLASRDHTLTAERCAQIGAVIRMYRPCRARSESILRVDWLRGRGCSSWTTFF